MAAAGFGVIGLAATGFDAMGLAATIGFVATGFVATGFAAGAFGVVVSAKGLETAGLLFGAALTTVDFLATLGTDAGAPAAAAAVAFAAVALGLGGIT